MIIALQILILVALVKVLIETENVLLCACIYTGVSALLGLLFGAPLLAMTIISFIRFGYVYAYFWLLSRFIDGGIIFWLILIIGLLAPVVLQFAIASIAA